MAAVRAASIVRVIRKWLSRAPGVPAGGDPIEKQLAAIFGAVTRQETPGAPKGHAFAVARRGTRDDVLLTTVGLHRQRLDHPIELVLAADRDDSDLAELVSALAEVHVYERPLEEGVIRLVGMPVHPGTEMDSIVIVEPWMVETSQFRLGPDGHVRLLAIMALHRLEADYGVLEGWPALHDALIGVDGWNLSRPPAVERCEHCQRLHAVGSADPHN